MISIDGEFEQALRVILNAHERARPHLGDAVDPQSGKAPQEVIDNLLGCFDTQSLTASLDIVQAKLAGQND